MASSFKGLVTTYSTTRLVKIKSPFIAILYWLLVVLVLFSFLRSLNLDIRKTYQSSCPVRGVILSKVKGFVSTEYLDDLAVDNPQLYKRIWDDDDIVKSGEGKSGSFSITTNLIITPNQTMGNCSAKDDEASKCTHNGDCPVGYWSPFTHGIYTGNCSNQTGTCEIHGWCPIESNDLPRRKEAAAGKSARLFAPSQKYCGVSRVRTPRWKQSIFRIGDIVKWSGDDFSRVAIKGGVFSIKVIWNCDFDFGKTVEDCMPKYEFIRVDDYEKRDGELGWNFRPTSIVVYNGDNNMRTLKKLYGLKILISLEGEGRMFDFFQLVITLGATIGLFSVAPLACDFLLDLFNKLSNSRTCASYFSSWHDATASRYEQGSVEFNVTANKIRRLPSQGLYLSNPSTNISVIT